MDAAERLKHWPNLLVHGILSARRGLNPREPYEGVGDVPNVVFACAALADAPTGRLAIYYGCADTCTGLAYCHADELLDFVKSHSRL